MTQWIGKRAIVKKYQISNKELLHILKKREVAYTNIDGVWLVDEDSFAAYVNALRQAEKQNNAIHRLKQALRSGKKLKLSRAETILARRLEGRISSIYRIATDTLSLLLEPRERKIFLAFTKGDNIASVARQMKMKDKEVFLTLENIIKELSLQPHYIIEGLVKRKKEAEEINRSLSRKLVEYADRVSNAECETKKIKAEMTHILREREGYKIYLDYMEDMFKAEKRINAGLEEILAEHWQHDKTDYISSILSYLSSLFHRKKE